MAHISVHSFLAPRQDGMAQGHGKGELLKAWQTGSRERLKGGAELGDKPFRPPHSNLPLLTKQVSISSITESLPKALPMSA